MQKFNIVFVAVSRNAIPPTINTIDGIATISTVLADELQKKGHNITFITPKGSTIATKRVESSLPPMNLFYTEETLSLLSPSAKAELQNVFDIELHRTLTKELNQNSYDIVHFHTSPLVTSIPFTKDITIPKLFTLHDQFPSAYTQLLTLYPEMTDNYFVSISNAQQHQIGKLNYIRNIYHGIDTSLFKYQQIPTGDYIFFSGRFHPLKGLDIAIDVARRTVKKLRISGQESSAHREYYDIQVKPYIDNTQITYKKLASKEELIAEYQNSKLTLLPLKWEEPFGLVFIEAMATGSPVVAFARGAVPEIIKDGETGFLVNPSEDDIRGDFIIKKTGVEGLCEAVEKIFLLPQDKYLEMRRKTREHTEKNFALNPMVSSYESVYEELLLKNRR